MSEEAAAVDNPAEAGPQNSGAWFDGLPSDLKNDPYVKKFSSPEEMVKSAISAQTLIGRKGVIPPKEGDPPEAFSEWRKAIGVPDKADAYDASVLGDSFSESERDVLRQRALDAGMPESSWRGFAEGLAETRTARRAELSQAAEARMGELKKKWGAAYESKMALAESAGADLFGESFEAIASRELADGTKLSTDPSFIVALASIGEAVGEGGTVVPGAKTGSSRNLMTPEEADAAYRSLVSDPAKVAIMQNTAHPECRLLNEQRKRLSTLRAAGGQ